MTTMKEEKNIKIIKKNLVENLIDKKKPTILRAHDKVREHLSSGRRCAKKERKKRIIESINKKNQELGKIKKFKDRN